MFRQPSPRQVQAEADAMMARVDAMFDAVFADVGAVTASAAAAGLLRDPRSRTRAGDPPQPTEQAA